MGKTQLSQVKDPNNLDFLMKLLATFGLRIPPISTPEKALVETAQTHKLLGESATLKDLEAQIWGCTK